ncbi:solute carrier organic anion transporter family member 2B1 isoform X2 [Cherax quadricarinatus]|uniref:solute carrier organic anion transporter family member 2B1 isoform X2 n=1 Tax=Cherax quadricarinatus TaxID=27406 RepID=UPI00387E2DDB
MSPVCVRDGPITLSYYSPCHAGCPHPTNQDNLTNCTCGSAAAQITRGYCRDKCSIFVLYNVVNCITKSLLSVTIIGSLLITLRRSYSTWDIAENGRNPRKGRSNSLKSRVLHQHQDVLGSRISQQH